jgi:hypothetical protein
MEVEALLASDGEEQDSLSDDDDEGYPISHHYASLEYNNRRAAGPTSPYGPKLPVPQPVLEGDLAATLNNATAAYGPKDVAAQVQPQGVVLCQGSPKLP